MKELIEKIKNRLGYKDTTFSVQEKDLIDVGLNIALNDIYEQENKEFNPEGLGFTKLNDIMFNKIENNCEFILERMRTPNLWLLKQVIDSHRFKFDPIPLMIPNHRQGVESLRVLGIIK